MLRFFHQNKGKTQFPRQCSGVIIMHPDPCLLWCNLSALWRCIPEKNERNPHAFSRISRSSFHRSPSVRFEPKRQKGEAKMRMCFFFFPQPPASAHVFFLGLAKLEGAQGLCSSQIRLVYARHGSTPFGSCFFCSATTAEKKHMKLLAFKLLYAGPER